MIEVDDKNVVERVLEGKKDDYRYLVQKYQKPVYHYIYRMIHNQEAAKEITQQVFVKCFEKLSSYNSNYKFFSWIYRITINETINYIKYHKRVLSIDEYKGKLYNKETDSLEKTELKMILEKAVSELAIKFQSVINLKYFEDLSYTEIAEILGISEKKVKSRLFTARKKLIVKLRDIL